MKWRKSVVKLIYHQSYNFEFISRFHPMRAAALENAVIYWRFTFGRCVNSWLYFTNIICRRYSHSNHPRILFPCYYIHYNVHFCNPVVDSFCRDTREFTFVRVCIRAFSHWLLSMRDIVWTMFRSTIFIHTLGIFLLAFVPSTLENTFLRVCRSYTSERRLETVAGEFSHVRAS